MYKVAAILEADFLVAAEIGLMWMSVFATIIKCPLLSDWLRSIYPVVKL